MVKLQKILNFVLGTASLSVALRAAAVRVKMNIFSKKLISRRVLFAALCCGVCFTGLDFCKPAFAQPHASAEKKKQAADEIDSRKTTKEPLNEFEVGRYQYCGSDDDCMVALNGCCPCGGKEAGEKGGEYVAINKDHFKDFQKRFDCLKVSCPDDPARSSCERGVVSCKFHKCHYFSPEEARP